MNWEYHRGEWTETQKTLMGRDKEIEDFEVVLERSGYRVYPVKTFGAKDNTFCVELYESYGKETDPPYSPYLISFSFSGDDFELVFINDLPSLMQWLRDYAPIFLLTEIADKQEELFNLLEKKRY